MTPRNLVLHWDRANAARLAGASEAMNGGVIPLVAYSTQIALEALRSEPAELAIVAVQMPDLHGLDFIPLIVEHRLARRLLAVTVHKDFRTLALLRGIVEGMIDGVTAELPELGHAIGEVLAERAYISPALVPLLTNASAWSRSQPLTPQEELVLSVVGSGLSNELASPRLAIPAETVRNHRNHIMQKLELHHKGDLMRYALLHNYVKIEDGRIMHPGFERELSTLHERGRALFPVAPCVG